MNGGLLLDERPSAYAEPAGPPDAQSLVAQVFATSYRRLVAQLYAVVGSAAEAEDLVQEAFVRAYATGPAFADVVYPEAWLRQTALNLQHNRWRKLRNFERIRHRLHHREEAPDHLQGIGDHVEVVAALRELPEYQRIVLVLHYLADRSVEQISEELGIATGTVKSRLSRGRAALALVLGVPGG